MNDSSFDQHPPTEPPDGRPCEDCGAEPGDPCGEECPRWGSPASFFPAGIIQASGRVCSRCEVFYPEGHYHECSAPDPTCFKAYDEKVENLLACGLDREALREMHAWLRDLTWQATGRTLA